LKLNKQPQSHMRQGNSTGLISNAILYNLNKITCLRGYL